MIKIRISARARAIRLMKEMGFTVKLSEDTVTATLNLKEEELEKNTYT